MQLNSGVGAVPFGDDREFNGVRVFSATVMSERGRLGEKVTEWLAHSDGVEIRDIVVTQSSDEAYHCIAITLFYWQSA